MNANTALKINDAIDQAIRCGESVDAVNDQVRKALDRALETYRPATRYAIVPTTAAAKVAVYLPPGYHVVGYVNEREVLIAGEDHLGWTLDGYVLPRLQSGAYYGREVSGDEVPSIVADADGAQVEPPGRVQ